MEKTKQETMQGWANQIKLDDSVIEKLINKYGENEAYRLMREALLHPYELAPKLEGYDDKKISSKNLLLHMVKEDNQTEAIPANDGNASTPTIDRIDREHIKYTMKNDALTARIVLNNGKFTSQIQQEIIGELTPIYGPEISEKIYQVALNRPADLYNALENKPDKLTSRAILQHILTLEDQKDINNVKDATRNVRIISSDRFSQRPTNSDRTNNTPPRQNGNSSSRRYTVGNYTSVMPRELAVGCEATLYNRENNNAKHYLCANGYLTNIGVTHRYYPEQFRDTFGNETTDLLLKAEKAARSRGTQYSTDGGKTWNPMPSSGGSDFLLGGLQRKIDGGKKCLIKATNGDVIELKRIPDAGFEIIKVNGTEIPHPSDMTKSRELNMRVLDANYRIIKSTCGRNWDQFSTKEQVQLVYSHFHQPEATQLAYTNRTSNTLYLPTNRTVDIGGRA